jgi:hypothetical protein
MTTTSSFLQQNPPVKKKKKDHNNTFLFFFFPRALFLLSFLQLTHLPQQHVLLLILLLAFVSFIISWIESVVPESPGSKWRAGENLGFKQDRCPMSTIQSRPISSGMQSLLAPLHHLVTISPTFSKPPVPLLLPPTPPCMEATDKL